MDLMDGMLSWAVRAACMLVLVCAHGPASAIVGGRLVAAGEDRAAWVVAIHKSGFLRFFGERDCTGVFIAPHAVLTAAHCVSGTGTDGAAVSIRIGGIRPSHESRSMRVDRVVIHPGYAQPEEGLGRHDVALLRTVEPKPAGIRMFTVNEDRQPLALPHTYAVLGYGADEAVTGAFGLGVLRIAETSITREYKTLLESDQRAGGICRGDSGGPLVEIRGAELVSIGISHAIGQGPNPDRCRNQGFYMKTSAYADWIARVVATF
ncbi:MAG: S1 family peptidase [Comamonas sp.]